MSGPEFVGAAARRGHQNAADVRRGFRYFDLRVLAARRWALVMGVTRTVLLDSTERKALFFAAFETVTRCWLITLFIVSLHWSFFQKDALSASRP